MKNHKNLIIPIACVGALLAIKKVLQKITSTNLRGKVILVTGGTRGLGLVLGRNLAKTGARLAVCARNKDEVKKGCQDLQALGAEVTGYICDITDRDQVNRMVAKIQKKFGPIDILVNNAGVIKVGPIECMTYEDFEEGMNTHFWGPLHLIFAVLPEMQKRQSGHIVNISSIGGKVSIPHLIPYIASKFALTGLSEGLSVELAKDNINVTTVCPGLMRTGGLVNAYFKGQHQKEYVWFAILNSLPGISTSVDHAARRIIKGIRAKEAEIVITLLAKMAVWFNNLFPETTIKSLSIINRLLPSCEGIGKNSKKGKESGSKLPQWIRTLSEQPSRRNNELL